MQVSRLKMYCLVVLLALGVITVPPVNATMPDNPNTDTMNTTTVAAVGASNPIYLPIVVSPNKAAIAPTRTATPVPNPTATPKPIGGCTVTATSVEWSTIAGNPQRTSSTPEEVGCNLKVIWYRPIEAYIPQNAQIIAANGMVYVATAKGLYALDANTGDVRWRFDTEMPLGNSPTVFNGVVYVPSLDKRLFALNANTGAKIWSFDSATAGFSTNPLVLSVNGKPVVYLGNRDGNFYAIQDNGASASLLWSFATQGPINFSAAASKDNSRIYFASNDSYAYALSATGGSLLWKTKLPGEGFDSYWPVVYTDRFTSKDFVVFAGANLYNNAGPIGVRTLEAAPYNFANNLGGWSSLQTTLLNKAYGFTGSLPGKTPSNSWEQGKAMVNASPMINWLEDYPDANAQSGNRGKPWQRTVVMLNAGDGSEYTFDSNGNGKPEHAPLAFWGTRNGNAYPPIVSPTGAESNVLYTNNITNNAGAAGNAIVGWETGTPYMSTVGILGTTDEPQALSFGGNTIYRNLCCDRVADYQNIVTGATGQLWPYNSSTGAMPGYDAMWRIDVGYPRWNGWYTGAPQYGYTNNGVYHNHGDQNPIVPYAGKLFTHRSNAIMAFGPSSAPAYGNKGALSIQNVTDASIPTLSTATVKQKLENEILKMIAAGNLRIGYYNNGQSQMEELVNYFETPADTLYTLAAAYPYLSASTQQQLIPYLKREFADYFNPVMYTSRGWVGAAREAYDMAPEIASVMATKPKIDYRNYVDNPSTGYVDMFPQFSFYALWKYAQVVPSDTLTAYNLAKSKVIAPTWLPDKNFITYPWRLNNYIAGYIGFLNLQKLAGKDVTDAALRTQVTNELNRLQTLRAANFSAKRDGCRNFYGGDDVTCFAMTVGQNFVYLVPELGDYINKNAYTAANNTINELTYVAPYWWQEGYTSAHLEKAKTNLYDSTLFLGKAYILKQPYAELSKYLDAPAFAVGDLIYIQNLVAALSAP